MMETTIIVKIVVDKALLQFLQDLLGVVIHRLVVAEKLAQLQSVVIVLVSIRSELMAQINLNVSIVITISNIITKADYNSLSFPHRVLYRTFAVR